MYHFHSEFLQSRQSGACARHLADTWPSGHALPHAGLPGALTSESAGSAAVLCVSSQSPGRAVLPDRTLSFPNALYTHTHAFLMTEAMRFMVGKQGKKSKSSVGHNSDSHPVFPVRMQGVSRAWIFFFLAGWGEVLSHHQP